MPSGRSIAAQFLPSLPAVLLGFVALAILGLWALLSLAMVVTPLDDQTMFGAAASIGAVFFGPASAVFLGIAGLVDRRPLARAAWFWLATATILMVGVVLGLAMALEPVYEGFGSVDGESLGVGIFGGTCCGFMPMIVFLLPALAFTTRGLRGLRDGSVPESQDAVVELLHRRGCATFEEITAASGVPADRIEQVLFQLKLDGRLLCRMEPNVGWVCTQRHEQEGLRMLPGLVAARARIDLAELSRELNAPPPVLRAWIYKAVGSGALSGYMNWKKGVVYASDAHVLRSGSQCPACGGRLELVGRGVVQCPYCDAEIFL